MMYTFDESEETSKYIHHSFCAVNPKGGFLFMKSNESHNNNIP